MTKRGVKCWLKQLSEGTKWKYNSPDAIGEKLGIYRDYAVSRGCTSLSRRFGLRKWLADREKAKTAVNGALAIGRLLNMFCGEGFPVRDSW